ncbi:hypothetical protein [Faecalicatena contorta]|uniref:hypothetical protein n=1 Tax=Faecalicatena contorta TaxID=39482 RepID=UPI001F480D6B|nr:hypothetical protein [Faecalicatena contorta]MCF2555556.1 hypothetical protein [Faecalicatena contorta]
MEHDGCKLCKYESFSAESKECLGCKQNAVDKYKKMTQADRIRAMSDEELAEFLCKVKSDYQWSDHEFPSEEECGEWVEWLQSEVEE